MNEKSHTDRLDFDDKAGEHINDVLKELIVKYGLLINRLSEDV